MISEPRWKRLGVPGRADVLTPESPRVAPLTSQQRPPAPCPAAFLTQAARTPYFTEGGLMPTKRNDCFLTGAPVDRSNQKRKRSPGGGV